MQTAHEAAVAAAAAASARGSASAGSGRDSTGGGASAGPGSPNSDGSLQAEHARSSAAQNLGSDALPEGAGGAGGAGGVGPAVDAAAEAAAAAPPPESSLLLDLEKKPLLKVFVFLNATEVLRAAQVCRPMFRKVGAFGSSDHARYRRALRGSSVRIWSDKCMRGGKMRVRNLGSSTPTPGGQCISV